jgi:hypothetical protein
MDRHRKRIRSPFNFGIVWVFLALLAPWRLEIGFTFFANE